MIRLRKHPSHRRHRPSCARLRRKTVAWISSSVRLRTPTLAPARAKSTADALPMPDPAPVTSATLPWRSIGSVSAGSSLAQLVNRTDHLGFLWTPEFAGHKPPCSLPLPPRAVALPATVPRTWYEGRWHTSVRLALQ